MSEIQVGQINSTDGSTAITTGADGYVSFAKTQIGGRRNLIINGAMQVAQRGTSFTGLGAGTSYQLDRWQLNEAGASDARFTVTQDPDAPNGFSSSYKVDVTTADTGLAATEAHRLRTLLEGQDLQQLAFGTSDAKSITLSFWVKSNKTGQYSAMLFNQDADPDRKNYKGYTINSADTWEYKTITYDGDTDSGSSFDNDNGVGMIVWWNLSAGNDRTDSTTGWHDSSTPEAVTGQVNLADSTSNYWQITGVQLEVGTVATPFEHISYGEQLALCQRYYWKYGNEGSYTAYGSGVSESDTRARLCVDYPCFMRANPTFSVTNIGNTYIGRGNVTSVPTQLDDSYPGKNKALVDVGYGSAGGAGAGRIWFANSATLSSIQADAEL